MALSTIPPIADLIKKVEELHYSRLPVYKETFDDIVGMLNTKDLLPLYIITRFDWHIIDTGLLYLCRNQS